MKTTVLDLELLTPGFLGGSDQKGEWRAPPIKALFRHWYRILIARRSNYDHREIREAEGNLFGNAWLADNRGRPTHSRSIVTMSLDSWSRGTQRSWSQSDPRVHHPETTRAWIGSHLYLGYGPLTIRQGSTTQKVAPTLAHGERRRLRLKYPESFEDCDQLVRLVVNFGTLGGRSRNGWGSLHCEEFAMDPKDLCEKYSRNIRDCLTIDWPHAFGVDAEGLLMWQTRDHSSWSQLLKHLAEVKIAFRTQQALSLRGHHSGGPFRDRHLLAYPVTNHSVGPWGNQSRLANQIRFKAVKTEGGLRGIVFHLPCALPEVLSRKLGRNAPSLNQQLRIWQCVHSNLDSMLQRV